MPRTPWLDPEERREKELRIRTNDQEREILDAAAELAGEPTSTWLRMIGLKAARRILAKSKKG